MKKKAKDLTSLSINKLHVRRVMVIDDSYIVRDYVKTALEEKGYFVIEAFDGVHALTKLEYRNIDLFLVDIQMPKMNGIDFIKTIRKMGINTPVVVITAGMTPEERIEVKSLGVRATSTKPFKIENLVRCVETLLNEKEITK